MSGRRYGSAYIGVAGVVAGVSFAPGAEAGAADAGEPPVVATMTCDRAAEPGRVKCSLEARAAANHALAWADAVVIELPDFAGALKGRIGPADAIAREPSVRRWAFGLVAKRTGEGAAKVRVRAVVCDGPVDAAAPRCVPVTLDVRATLRVG